MFPCVNIFFFKFMSVIGVVAQRVCTLSFFMVVFLIFSEFSLLINFFFVIL